MAGGSRPPVPSFLERIGNLGPRMEGAERSNQDTPLKMHLVPTPFDDQNRWQAQRLSRRYRK